MLWTSMEFSVIVVEKAPYLLLRSISISLDTLLSSRFSFEKLLDFVSLILILIFENWNFRYCPVLLEHPLIVPCLYRLPK